MAHSVWCSKGVAGVLIGVFSGSSAIAVVEQSVAVEWDPDPAAIIRAFATFDGFQNPPGPPRVISANMAGDGFSGVAAAGPFGNLGMAGQHFAPGTMLTKVDIRDSEIPNPFGSPRHAKANFIIDGGFLRLLGATTSKLTFALTLQADISDSGGNHLRTATWQSWAEMTSVDFEAPTLQLGANDIGIHMSSQFEAEIPLSLQTFDLGTIPAGGNIDLQYQVYVESRSPSIEIMRWAFSDPLSLEGEQEAPRVQFDPVPEPASLAALGLGLLALRRRRPKSARA